MPVLEHLAENVQELRVFLSDRMRGNRDCKSPGDGSMSSEIVRLLSTAGFATSRLLDQRLARTVDIVHWYQTRMGDALTQSGYNSPTREEVDSPQWLWRFRYGIDHREVREQLSMRGRASIYRQMFN